MANLGRWRATGGLGGGQRHPRAATEVAAGRRLPVSRGKMCPKCAHTARSAGSRGMKKPLTWASGEGPGVELPGIEPGSSVASSGLLRVQFAVSLLGSLGHANKPR